MAIPAELRAFENEAGFRDRFVMPLLHRLGFSIVVNYHGQREFGRDIIFGEIDRFGHVLYSGLQVKFTNSISQSDSHGLLADAKESFAHEFRHPQRNTQEHVCRFYVMNAGSIADNARDNVFALLERPSAANSVLLDGPALLTLDRFAAISRGTMVEQLLAGLLIEVRSNRSNPLGPGLNSFASTRQLPLARLRVAATVAMLERPVILESAFLVSLQDYWDLARTVNHVADLIDVPFLNSSAQDERVRLALDLIARLDEQSRVLERLLLSTMADLGGTLA